jgi:hypothetical protein
MTDAIMQLLDEATTSTPNATFAEFSTTDDVAFMSNRILLLDSIERQLGDTTYTIKGDWGLPQVTLRGTLDDLESLRERTCALKFYANPILNRWIETLEPILEKLVETYRGDVDKKWWREILSEAKAQEPSEDVYKGWICAFFPYCYDASEWFVDFQGEIRGNVPHGRSDISMRIENNRSGSEEYTLVAGSLGVSVIEDGGLRPCLGWYLAKK